MIALLYLCLLGGAVFAWDHSAVGLGWAALLIGICVSVFALRSAGRLGRRLCLMLASVLMALALLEFGLEWKATAAIDDNEPDIFQDDEDLGYRLKASTGGLHVKQMGDEEVFRSQVTIGPDGWRLVPRPGLDEGAALSGEGTAAPAPGRRVDVLGCSFAFGYGLSDEEALSSVLQERLGPTSQVRSLSARGWGPHQLLAGLQSGAIAPTPGAPTDWAVYWAISDHVLRAAGKRRFDVRGPHFGLEDGIAKRVGNFDDATLVAPHILAARSLEKRSALARRILLGASKLAHSAQDLGRWAAIVEGIQGEFAAWESAPRFLVMLQVKGAKAEAMAAELATRGIEVLDLAEIYKNAPKGSTRVHPKDGHPSAALVQRIADVFVERIQRGS